MTTSKTNPFTRKYDRTRPAAMGCLLAAVATFCGCAKFNLPDSVNWFEKEPQPLVPQRMVPVWTHSVMNRAGQPSQRGFGGRISFFGTDNQAPILVDGQLTVYAFDDDDPDPDNPAPEKKFIFPRDRLASHQSESNLGPSYSFWLPWDEQVGGPQRKLSLIGRFDDAEGRVILSQPASMTLPGKVDPERLKVTQTPATALHQSEFPVRQAMYESVVPDSDEEEPETKPSKHVRMQTTTIPITPSFADRLGSSADPARESLGGETHRRTDKPIQMPPTDSTPSSASDSASPPSGRSEFGQSPVRNSAITRPSSGHVRRQPFRGEWLRHLPPTPRTDLDRVSAGWTEDAEQP
jgi:hypothetical protein